MSKSYNQLFNFGPSHGSWQSCNQLEEPIVDFFGPFRGVEESIMDRIIEAVESTFSPFGEVEGSLLDSRDISSVLCHGTFI